MISSISKCASYIERLNYLHEKGTLCTTTKNYLLENPALEPELAENFIENAIGHFGIPLGIADHFVINDQPYMIPMAIEETSVIAAASKTAKWIKKHGTIKTSTSGNTLVGQIQIDELQDSDALQVMLHKEYQPLIDHLNQTVAARMFKRGGGVKDFCTRVVDHAVYPNKKMHTIHLHIDVQDAMGANLVNQVCEAAKKYLQARSDEKFNICILSNLNPQTVTKAKITLHNIPTKMGEAIETCSHFAESDPYRAATHNKGILNGIDAVLIATGNDWRAVEAGLHAYAGFGQGYKPLSTWRFTDGVLTGEFVGPINVGIVGGVTNLHPMAKISMEILKPSSAKHLAEIIAAVGLTQNLGAMRALSTVGITQGHMRLHIDNIMLPLQLEDTQKLALRAHLEQVLKEKNVISTEDALNYLNNK